MYKFRFENIENTYPYEELIKVFLSPDEYMISGDMSDEDASVTYRFSGDRDGLKRAIYTDLRNITGKSPKWGILTGIRPVKLAGELFDSVNSIDSVKEIFRDKYLLHESKSSLVTEILEFQRKEAGKPEKNSISLYIGIPFCPTRCLYCSFTSNQVDDGEMERYLEALKKEIIYCGRMAEEQGRVIESVYFGGGTPTSLSASQLDNLLSCVDKSFDLSYIREYTVEAGRPDTITEEKLKVIKEHKVDRISINPQTTKEKTLEIIGRKHTIEDLYKAFEKAGKVGIETVNTDLIAGLPEETAGDFAKSIRDILKLGAENITLHTLAVKRASKLKDKDAHFNYRDEDLREIMLEDAHSTLREYGYRPYYLYRQKHTSGNTENTGFCRDNKLSLYNVRIMEEAQSILALGAGGISKIYFPEENRLERVANVSNYEIYIDRIDEMIYRKDKKFFIWR